MKKADSALPATLKDVANAANVSVATVSRALNLPDMLAPETLARVRSAIASTGYVPTMMSAGVATNRSRLVAVVMSAGPFQVFESTFRAIASILNTHGYQAMLMLLPPEGPERSVAFGQLFSRRPEGLVSIGVPPSAIPDPVRDLGLPIVEAWEIPRAPLDMVVGVRHEEIGRALGRFVLDKGWKSPLLVQFGGAQALDRRFGLTRYLVEHGRDEPRLSALYSIPGRVAEGRAALVDAIAGGGLPDVAICMSDWLAIGVLVEAKERGIRVPEDLAIIGFGGFQIVADMAPAITSLAIDGERIGREAATMLVARMGGQDPGERIRDVGFTIIEGGTT